MVKQKRRGDQATGAPEQKDSTGGREGEREGEREGVVGWPALKHLHFLQDSCITMHTDHFVVLADDLASQPASQCAGGWRATQRSPARAASLRLEVVAQSPGEFLSESPGERGAPRTRPQLLPGQYEDTYTTSANVVTAACALTSIPPL